MPERMLHQKTLSPLTSLLLFKELQEAGPIELVHREPKDGVHQ